MAEACKTCEAKTQYEYWNNLPDIKHSFFKIMLGDFERQLRIPMKFVKNLKEKLSCRCILRGPSGNEWNVQIRKTKEDVFFMKGWDRFVRDHAIKMYDFLVFTYEGYSTFTVLVFDATGCEKEGTYFVRVNMPESSSCKSVFHLEENEHGTMREQDTTSEVSLRRNYSRRSESTRYNAVYKGKWKLGSLSKCNESFGDNDEATVVVIDDDDDGDGDGDDYDMEDETKKSISSRPLVKQAQKFHVSSRREVADQEKRTAYKMAAAYIKRHISNGVPMVGIVMLPTHVYKGLCLTIPKDWAMTNMINEDHEVELQVSGSDNYWLVGCRWTPRGQCQLRPKWAEFVLDNNIEDGDVCVFKLVHQGKTMPVFKVRIFRVIEEVAPLIPKRMAV